MAASVRDRIMRFVLNRWSSAVVMVSDALAQTYLAGGGIARRKIRVVHNGVELERFRRDASSVRSRIGKEFDIPDGKPVVVSVAVLRAGKGVEVLLDAARNVTDAVFLIVGDGAKREEWMDAARRGGIADRMRWAGYRTDVDQILAGCDVFVHPSLDDAFPTVLLEAMAAGLPVVASSVGGIPEIVDSDVTGILVPPGDSAALAEAVGSLLSDRPRLARMAEAARVRADRQFSTAAWTERLAVVYENVLAEAQKA